MKTKLLLHYRADCNTNDIWKAAIKRGWSTDRVHDIIEPDIGAGFDRVIYYGNTLQVERIGNALPVRFHPLPPEAMANSRLTGRAIRLMHLRDMPAITAPVFIKPVYQKYFEARVYVCGEVIEAGSLPDDLIYVQEPVNMLNEVRCFCLNGTVHTASYYRVSGEYHPVNFDEHRPTVIDEMVKELAPFYAPGCVLDFAFTDKRKWVFVEPNEAWASGIYECDPDKCLDVIEASQLYLTPPSSSPPPADAATPSAASDSPPASSGSASAPSPKA